MFELMMLLQTSMKVALLPSWLYSMPNVGAKTANASFSKSTNPVIHQLSHNFDKQDNNIVLSLSTIYIVYEASSYIARFRKRPQTTSTNTVLRISAEVGAQRAHRPTTCVVFVRKEYIDYHYNMFTLPTK